MADLTYQDLEATVFSDPKLKAIYEQARQETRERQQAVAKETRKPQSFFGEHEIQANRATIFEMMRIDEAAKPLRDLWTREAAGHLAQLSASRRILSERLYRDRRGCPIGIYHRKDPNYIASQEVLNVPEPLEKLFDVSEQATAFAATKAYPNGAIMTCAECGRTREKTHEEMMVYIEKWPRCCGLPAQVKSK